MQPHVQSIVERADISNLVFCRSVEDALQLTQGNTKHVNQYSIPSIRIYPKNYYRVLRLSETEARTFLYLCHLFLFERCSEWEVLLYRAYFSRSLISH